MRLEDIELMSKFKNLYCLYNVISSIKSEINEYILNALPLNVTEKIISIDILMDSDNFLVLNILVDNDDAVFVYDYLHMEYEVFEWIEDTRKKFTNIYLIFNDEIICSLQQFLYDDE